MKVLFVFGALGLLITGCSNNSNGHSETPFDHQHNWSTPVYKWSENFSSCTAERTCQSNNEHKETETVDSTYALLTEPTCDSNGLGRYTATFINSAFATQTHDVVFDATGHDWGETTYTWSDDNSVCTAQRICKIDPNHKQTETVNSTYSILRLATCEEDGLGKYTASFANVAFTVQTKEVSIDATGHVWGQPTYVWSQDNSICTAERICANDTGHKQTESVSSAYSIINGATCEVDGLGRYTAVFTNSVFGTQTKDIKINYIGHEWGLPSYSWTFNGSAGTCAAERVCLHDDSHKQTETKVVSSTIINNPTYDKKGLRRYTATFTNTAFETQTTDVDIPIKSMLTFTKYGTYCAAKADSTDIYGAIEIPEYYDGLPVTEIDDFFACDRITSVSIPSTVERIANNAFRSCSMLETITFSEGLKTIGNYAFNGCTSIKNIELPESVETVSLHAFDGCTNLLTFKFGDSIERLDGGIFYGCSSLKSLTVPFVGKTASSEQYLGYLFGFELGYTFDNPRVPSSLKELIISDACSSLDNHALDGCNSIESLRIPFVGGSKTDNKFLAYIFGGSTVDDETIKVPTSLKKVIVSDLCTEIADKAFYRCSSLKEVDLGNGILTIGWRAFYGCSSIESLVTPDTVTSIGDSAFGFMTSLISVNILGPNTRIGLSVFSGSTSLISIRVVSENIYYSSSNEALYSKDGTRLICCPGGLEGTFTIPSTVTEIEEYAFYHCEKLTNIIIPNSVTTIEDHVFAYCSSLLSIDLPDDLLVLEPYSFSECSSLETVSLPNGLTTIGRMAFYNCVKLNNILISSSVTSIGDRTFVYCSSLSEINLPSSLQTIGEYCFAYCSSLGTIDVPASVETLDKALFMECSSLESVTLHSGLKTIGLGAFLKCSSLTAIDVPDSVTSMDSAVFENCSSLTSFEMPHYVTNISQELFSGCTSLKQVTLSGYDYGTIGKSAFYNCTSLETIELPGITTIADYAFYNCSSLWGIGFDETISSVGNYCLYKCTSLTDVYYAGTTSHWTSVTKGTSWKFGVPASVIVCSNGNALFF